MEIGQLCIMTFYLPIIYIKNSETVLGFVSRYINEELNYKNFQKGLIIVDKIFNLDEKTSYLTLKIFITSPD